MLMKHSKKQTFGSNNMDNLMHHNPNTFAGLVGKVREGGREGGEKKRAQRARRTRGSNPGPAAC